MCEGGQLRLHEHTVEPLLSVVAGESAGAAGGRKDIALCLPAPAGGDHPEGLDSTGIVAGGAGAACEQTCQLDRESLRPEEAHGGYSSEGAEEGGDHAHTGEAPIAQVGHGEKYKGRREKEAVPGVMDGVGGERQHGEDSNNDHDTRVAVNGCRQEGCDDPAADGAERSLIAPAKSPEPV